MRPRRTLSIRLRTMARGIRPGRCPSSEWHPTPGLRDDNERRRQGIYPAWCVEILSRAPARLPADAISVSVSSFLILRDPEKYLVAEEVELGVFVVVGLLVADAR